MIDVTHGTYNTYSHIIFKTAMLKSHLCDCIDIYTLAKGIITISGTGVHVLARLTDERN